jgi:putative transposase
VLNKPGPRPGTLALPPEVELRIEDAIEAVFKQRERPSVARLRQDIRQDCEAAGLVPPSRKAIEARLSAHLLKDLVRARDGATIARQRFSLVKPGLRPRMLLDLVQINHTKVGMQLVDDLARAVLGRPWTCIPAVCWASWCRSIRRRRPVSRSLLRKACCLKPSGSLTAAWI